MPFDGRMCMHVGQGTHGMASYRDFVWLSFPQVCELKGIVNVP